jgi:hypothetical protein
VVTDGRSREGGSGETPVRDLRQRPIPCLRPTARIVVVPIGGASHARQR